MGEKLTAKQAGAVEALLQGASQEKAAARAGVSVRTMARWQNDPAFRAALMDAEEQVLEQVSRRLVLLTRKALAALEDVLDNPGQRGASSKRLAAQSVMELMLKLREMRNIEERLIKLEEAVNHGD